VFFISIFIQSREQWWGLIPGITLLAIAVLIILNDLFPRLSGVWGGGIVLGGIGLAFLVVYLVNPANWWALIPMGVMLTLAGVSVLDEITRIDTGGLFFLGLGVLGLMGVFISASSVSLMGYIGPAILILAGLFFILRTAR
jgi:hypothetical protein